MLDLNEYLIKEGISHTVSDDGRITVGGDLYLGGTGITTLPDGLTVEGYLDLSGTPITTLPDGLNVGGWLDPSGTPITALPDGLTVGGSLYLRDTGITTLPDGLSVGGRLDLSGTSITVLPDNLSVGGDLDLSYTSITALPDNLSVGGDLDLSGTGITTLPDGLTVGGWLDLRDTPITVLPDNLSVGGWIYLRGKGYYSQEYVSTLLSRIAELEASEIKLIEERDHAEDALSDMFEAATGERPEWSNWFGFRAAVDVVANRHDESNPPEIPEGCLVVPLVPTTEMIAAAMDSIDVTFDDDDYIFVHHDTIYAAMLAAAPKLKGCK